MGSLEMTCHDFECGGGCGSSAVCNNDSKDENICFSEAEKGSCSSNQGHDSDCILDIENGVDEVRISMGTMERECRICMLSLDSESGIAIELGCSCKDELAAAHQHCAEQWFRSKGNNICEICNSIAQNVVIPNNIESRQQISQVNTVSTNAAQAPVYEINTVSTYAVSVQATEVNTSSTNAFLASRSINFTSTNAVSVSSTSHSRAWTIVEQVTNVVFVAIIMIFILYLTDGGRN